MKIPQSLKMWLKKAKKEDLSSDIVAQKLKKKGYPEDMIVKIIQYYDKPKKDSKKIIIYSTLIIIIVIFLISFLYFDSFIKNIYETSDDSSYSEGDLIFFYKNPELADFFEGESVSFYELTGIKISPFLYSEKDYSKILEISDLVLLFPSEYMEIKGRGLAPLSKYREEMKIDERLLSFFPDSVDKSYAIPFMLDDYVFILKDDSNISIHTSADLKEWINNNPDNFATCYSDTYPASIFLINTLIHHIRKDKNIDPPVDFTDSEIQQIQSWFKNSQDPICRNESTYVINGKIIQKLKDDKKVLTFLREGLILKLLENNNIKNNLKYIIPDEGVALSSNVFVIPEKSNMKNESLQFIDYLLSEEPQKSLSEEFYFRSIRLDIGLVRSNLSNEEVLNKALPVSTFEFPSEIWNLN